MSQALLFDNLPSLTVLSAHDCIQQSADMAYPFRQEACFLYLTHLDEPGYLAILDGKARKMYIVAPPIDETRRLFDGKYSDEEIMKITGADAVWSHDTLEDRLKELAETYESVSSLKPGYYSHSEAAENPAIERLWVYLGGIFKEVQDVRARLHRHRAHKTSKEVSLLRKAIDVSMEGFRTVYSELASQQFEYEIEAALSQAFRMTGADGHAYDPIVASGKNALTLHYSKNKDPLPKNGLVLIDAGARYNGYCADITRTYAIGTPTKRQKAVHAAVEKAHHAIIALLGPGKYVKEYHEEVDAIMIDALKSLGLYEKPEDYRKYFPHAISHGLGIDVPAPLGNPTHFKPGMVLTVEPGIYIPEEEIGVRIEDDILITETGVENLSGDLPTGL